MSGLIKGKLRYVRETGEVEEFGISWDDPHQAMRDGNATLPDDDLRKITRTDVQLLESAAKDLEHNPINGFIVMDLRHIATKLAALLPPAQ